MERKTTDKGYASTRLILLQDSVLSVLASLLSILLVRWLADPIPQFSTLVAIYLLAALASSAFGFILTGSHRAVRRYATSRTWLLLVLSIFIKEAALVVVLLAGWIILPSMPLFVLLIAGDLIFSCIFVLYPRYAASVMMNENIEVVQKAGRKTALVEGTSPASIALADEAEESGRYHVAGFVTDNPDMVGRVIGDRIVYSYRGPKDLEGLQWRLGGIDCLLFPMEAHRPDNGADSSEETMIPQKDGMSFTGHAIKRIFDIGLSGALLIVFAPLIGICALAVWLEDHGPVLYLQERIGKGGEPFNILKFRSMRIDAENGKPALYAGEDDPRLTRVGKFLRQHHLDELPQLWNVFRGDMSFIGYRPERQYYIDQIMERNPRYRFLYQIRPGVTSYATLYNGYTDTMEKMLTRLDLDLFYLRNHSVMFDLRVLGLTFLSIISGRKF